MATVLFVDRLPTAPADGLFVNLLDQPADQDAGSAVPGLQEFELAALYRRHGEGWKRAFIEWMGALNTANAGLDWWAYTSTAKNLLSSPLGNRLFQVLAILELVEEQRPARLYVVGASPAQRAVIRRSLALSRPETKVVDEGRAREFGDFELLGRIAYQALRIGAAIVRWRRRYARPDADLIVFTYVDAGVADGNDAFFGRLLSLLEESGRTVRTAYVAHLLASYRRLLPRLARFRKHRYWPLFFGLSAADLAWGVRKAASALDPSRHDLSANPLPLDAAPLLVEAFRWDVAKGGYLYNLLTYRAAARIARVVAPSRFLYPYENKSLEKALLIGLREGAPQCRITGYQHTSVTPRHTTLLFAGKEASATPLPDRIVTAGDVTRAFLERNGNYPAGIFVTGCALRQNSSAGAGSEQPAPGRPRILLALSSSRYELAKSIAFFRSLDALGADFELGVRPHPEFPLSLLAPALRDWVARRARDFSGSPLAGNIDWCTVVAYVSSTVALEAMMQGKPVINIDLGEIVVPDPVLEAPPLWRRAANPAEFSQALKELNEIPPAVLAQDRQRTMEAMRAYLRPVTGEALEVFMQ